MCIRDRPARTQRITARLQAGETHAYLLQDLQAGDILTVSMQATSGNLDPAIGIVDTVAPLDETMAAFQADLQRLLAENESAAQAVEALRRATWKGDEQIAFSGVTDCYQPVERKLELTRECLKVCLEHRQAIGIITKNRMVCRDIDILAPMASERLARVWLSINSLDRSLTGVMEPGTTRSEGRLRAVRELTAAGIPCGVMIAPVIPGLNDHEIPAILQAAAVAGAKTAGYILLRLPLTVRPVFESWLTKHFPDRVERVLGRVRQTRDGELNSPAFHERMRGSGEIADQVLKMFSTFRKRYGLESKPVPHDFSKFVSRPADGCQMEIPFGD